MLVAGEHTPALLRVLARAPRSRERDALLKHVSRSAPADAARIEALDFSDIEQAWLSLVEDSANGVTLGMRYVGTERGAPEWRYVSVQHVDVGPPSRFIALCHRTGTLKTFRVEGISTARLDPSTPYRRADPLVVDQVRLRSIDGFEGKGPIVDCAFVVRYPEARWVAQNLPRGLKIDANDPVADRLRVRCSTAAVLRVARFVVGLGDAATVETPELSECVCLLARGALAQAVPPARAKRLRR